MFCNSIRFGLALIIPIVFTPSVDASEVIAREEIIYYDVSGNSARELLDLISGRNMAH